MHRSLALLATLVAVAVAPALAPSPAHANLFGKIKVLCDQGITAQVDPLGSPGAATSDHVHTFSCGTAITANTTTGDLLAGGTTAKLPGDHSGVWAPVFVKDGVNYGAGSSYYLAANGSDRQVQVPPNGLRFVMGDPHSTTQQSPNIVRWRCGDSGSQVYGDYGTLVAQCQDPWTFSLEIDAPDCWDGMRLDSPNHQDHMAYGYGDCPADHPVRVPQVQIAFRYPIAALGGRLSSDHGDVSAGSTAHADYWFAIDALEMGQIITCINDPARNFNPSPTCGSFTYAGTDTNPNPWLYLLERWDKVIGWVKTNGDPNWDIWPVPGP